MVDVVHSGTLVHNVAVVALKEIVELELPVVASFAVITGAGIEAMRTMVAVIVRVLKVVVIAAAVAVVAHIVLVMMMITVVGVVIVCALGSIPLLVSLEVHFAG